MADVKKISCRELFKKCNVLPPACELPILIIAIHCRPHGKVSNKF